MKFLIRVLVAALMAVIVGYGGLYYRNNRVVDPPRSGPVAGSLERAIGWVEANRAALLENPHAILWWMIGRAAEITHDARLVAAFDAYKTRYVANRRDNVWAPLVSPGSWVPVNDSYLNGLDYYQQFFLYAITCDAELGSIPAIRAQTDPAFCDRYPWKPACVTHQLMGQYFMQRSGCGDQGELQASMVQLQQRIRSQLAWDPRVVDVYLQRVLMLAETGAFSLIEPVWIQRILDVQRSDGGWSNVDPLFRVGGGRWFVLGERGIGFSNADSTLHATAQGLLLMALLDTRAGGEETGEAGSPSVPR